GSLHRSGWAHHFAGALARACRHHEPHHVRRARREVSDVGAQAFRILSGGGAAEGARSSQVARRGAPRKRRARGSTGMMAGRRGGVGGRARHIPVMLSEVLHALEPKSGAIIVDGTFGAGGYSKAILEAAECEVIAIDRDPEAVAAGRALAAKFPGRLKLVA